VQPLQRFGVEWCTIKTIMTRIYCACWFRWSNGL